MLTTVRRSRVARLRLVAGLMIAGLLARPAVSAATPAQEGPSGTADRPSAEVDDAGRGGMAEIDADPFRDSGVVVDDALGSLAENLAQQLDQLQAARTVATDAQRAADEARAVVDETQARVDDLTAQSDEVVVDAFMNPPEIGLEALQADSLAEATVKQQILDTQATANADVLERLATARDELEVQRAEEDERASAAEDAAADAAVALDDLESAQSQQALFIAQVQERLDRNLSESAALAEIDPELAAQIRSRESEIAGRIQEIRDADAMAEALEVLRLAQEEADRRAREEAERLAQEAAESGTGDIGGPSGSLVTVPCPAGGSITVDSAMGPGLEAMLAAASADGITLCGGGYRDPSEQIALREANCGTSYYAIYEMPSSQCSPPTARPGTSNHEQGLAVDFTCNGGGAIPSQSSPCFQWLDANAADYGFYNLPSEPWHWSNDGT
jgi:hypothetical protein